MDFSPMQIIGSDVKVQIAAHIFFAEQWSLWRSSWPRMSSGRRLASCIRCR